MTEFKEGYETFLRLNGANIASDQGANYILNIEREIDKFTNAMKQPTRKIDNTDVKFLKGFAAEWWHEGTFNINAAVKGVKTRASAPDNNGLVDIILSTGEEYSSKYCSSGTQSAKDQAKTNWELYKKYLSNRDGQNSPKSFEEYAAGKLPDDPYYLGQGRLIPTDQLKDAQEWLKRKIAKEANGGRPELVKAYQEALDKLTDRIESADGAKSIRLTENQSEELARLAKEGGFDPKKWGLTPNELVGLEDIMRQAFKAGLSAALVSVVLKVAPQICGTITKLIKEGEINADDFKQVGFAALEGGAQGFVRGTVAAAITVSIKAGKMGTNLAFLDADIIGAITAVALNTVQNACLLAYGKISKYEFADRCAQDFVITAFSMGLGVITAIITQSSVLGFMIGSFVGSVVGGFVYKGANSCVLAFCVESGSTFFGLVEQNYELPVDVLKSIGVKVFDYERFEPKRFTPQTFSIKRFEYQKFEPIKINVTFLRRGVIGVGSIGYV